MQVGQSLLDVLSVDHVFAVLYNNAAHISWSPASSLEDGQFRYICATPVLYISSQFRYWYVNRFCASEKVNGSITLFFSTPESTTVEVIVYVLRLLF